MPLTCLLVDDLRNRINKAVSYEIAMTRHDPQTVAAWHDEILRQALEWRSDHPDFRFSLRTSDSGGETRLAKGYWFHGNDRYLFFPPFRPNDPNNKTKTIGFVTRLNSSAQPTHCYIEVVFGSIRSTEMRAVHEKIVNQLGRFERRGSAEKYQRPYDTVEPQVAFREFLEKDYPRIRAIIDESGLAAQFVVSEPVFEEMLRRVERIRSGTGPRPGIVDEVVDVQGKDADEPRNVILFGPPGTGKTHWLRNKIAEYTDTAEDLDPEKWLQQTVSEYGWRPVIVAALAKLGGRGRVPQIRDHPWVLAKTRERGRASKNVNQTIWGFLQEHTPEEVETVKGSVRRAPFIFTKSSDSVWSLLEDWEEQDPEALELRRILEQGPASKRTEVRRYRMVTFHPSFSYEDFIRGIRPVVDQDSGLARFEMVDGVFKQICDEARANVEQRYALFIDEINRANISKVFGELITLIEPDKRARYDEEGRQTAGISVQLPGGSGSEAAEEPFAVPANLDIYGTMNTADRSIALLDVALRRRFEFREVPPDYSVLDEPVGNVDVARLLRRINDRLEHLLDRDHRIGHAYLMNAEDIDDLRRAFQFQIIPLLQEYFFDDFSRVALVLATTAGAPPFVRKERLVRGDLFPGASDFGRLEDRDRYLITDRESWTEESFVGVYATSTSIPPAQQEE